MTVRTRLLLFVSSALLLVVVLLGVLAFGLAVAERIEARAAGSGAHLEALRELDAATGQYGRQAAEQLLKGRERNEQLQEARNQMNRVLAALSRFTRLEVDRLGSGAELQSELPEIEKARQMTDLYHEIDASAIAAFAQQPRGASAAQGLFDRAVNFRLSNELQPLIDQGIAGETSETDAEQANLQSLSTRVLWGAGLIGVLGVVGLLLQGRGLHGAITRPVTVLTEQLAPLARSGVAPSDPLWLPGEFAPLAAHVAEIAHRLTRARGAEQRLQAIDSGQSQFLADVGHQLRTPLTVVRGESDVALRSDSADELRASMERIRAQAAEMTLLLDDLIDAARLSADAQPLVLSAVRVDEVVASIVEEGRLLTEPREISLEVASTPGLTINADFRRLKQVLMIGIDNAVKHSPPGASIRIETAREGERGTIRIIDQGPGILHEDQPRLFERFFRGRLEGEMLNPGFGIGLSIAKDIIDRHGGDIFLQNSPEGGAVFAVSLPLAGGSA